MTADQGWTSSLEKNAGTLGLDEVMRHRDNVFVAGYLARLKDDPHANAVVRQGAASRAAPDSPAQSGPRQGPGGPGLG